MREAPHIHWWKVPKADDPEFNFKLHRIIELMAEFMEVDPLFFYVMNVNGHWSVSDQRSISIERCVEPGGFLVILDDKVSWAFLSYGEFKNMYPLINTDRDLI